MLSRELLLARADQDLATAKDNINSMIEDYGNNRKNMEPGDDEMDVLWSLIRYLSDEVNSTDVHRDRAVVIAYLAVAVKMLHDERAAHA